MGHLDRRHFLTLAGSAAALLTGSPATAHSAAAPSVRLIRDTLLDPRALYFVSYDGLVNNASFQQDGILTHGGCQYAAWYTADRRAVVARRPLDSSRWETVHLPHELSVDDSHNVISLGVSPLDGRLHIAMDTHNSPVYYTVSAAGVVSDPDSQWTVDVFAPIQRTLGSADLGPITYPRFLTTPQGKLQLSYRTGQGSGNGYLELAEYDGEWTTLGAWTSATGDYTANGATSTTRNMYLHGLEYGPDGTLHAAFTWREGDTAVLCHPGGLANHDTGYVFSRDNGRTWRNSSGHVVANTGTQKRVSVTTPGHVIDPLGVDHALINQECLRLDSTGQPHVLISYVPGRVTECVTDFTEQRRSDGHTFHVWQDGSGWHKRELPVASGAFGRSRLVFDRADNAYVVMPRGKIQSASRASGWSDWRVVHDDPGMNAFGEVLVDGCRCADGIISVLYQQESEATTPSAVRVADFAIG